MALRGRLEAKSLIGTTRAFVKGRPMTQKLGAVGAAAVLASVPFGGLEPVAPPPQAAFGVDRAFGAAAFEITIKRAVAVSDLKPAVYAGEGKHLVAVVMDVVNVTSRPTRSITLSNLIRVRGAGVDPDSYPLPGTPEGTSAGGQIINIEDGTSINVFNPDVTYSLAMVWEASQSDVAELEVQVRDSWWSLSEGTHAFQPYWAVEPGIFDFVTTLPIKDNR